MTSCYLFSYESTIDITFLPTINSLRPKFCYKIIVKSRVVQKKPPNPLNPTEFVRVH